MASLNCACSKVEVKNISGPVAKQVPGNSYTHAFSDIPTTGDTVKSTKFTPQPGDHFTHDGIDSDRLFRTLYVGCDYIFAVDVKDNDECLYAVDGKWRKVDGQELATRIKTACVKSLIKQYSDGEISDEGVVKMIIGALDELQPSNPAPVLISDAMSAVIAERQRQVKKGYDAQSDSGYAEGMLARAGAAYAYSTFDSSVAMAQARSMLPWGSTDKFNGPERDRLVKAAALIVAEIESMDRRGV